MHGVPLTTADAVFAAAFGITLGLLVGFAI
jgi:hypothetical protein